MSVDGSKINFEKIAFDVRASSKAVRTICCNLKLMDRLVELN